MALTRARVRLSFEARSTLARPNRERVPEGRAREHRDGATSAIRLTEVNLPGQLQPSSFLKKCPAGGATPWRA
jgi:hypothetical protein